MLRVLTLAGGMCGAAGLSQFPAYSQQYLQRISGAVDELRIVVADFDASARDAGLTRAQALAELSGTPFLDNRQADLVRVMDRLAWLEEAKLSLTVAGPFERLIKAPRYADSDIGARALEDFQPAVPLSAEGAGFAGLGFVAGWGLIAGLMAMLGRLFRRQAAV